MKGSIEFNENCEEKYQNQMKYSYQCCCRLTFIQKYQEKSLRSFTYYIHELGKHFLSMKNSLIEAKQIKTKYGDKKCSNKRINNNMKINGMGSPTASTNYLNLVLDSILS